MGHHMPVEVFPICKVEGSQPSYRALTLASGTIPNTLFSAKWFKWSSVLGVQVRHQYGAWSPGQSHLPPLVETLNTAFRL
jgi:hypothetical protein